MTSDILSATGANGGGVEDWADNTGYLSGGIPPQEVTKNNDGTKTVKDYSMSSDGYLSITTSVYKVDKVSRSVSKGVAGRKNWKKFGDCTGKVRGLESGISTLSVDEIDVEWVNNDDDKDDENEEDTNYAEMAARDIQSRLKIERFRQRVEERKLGVANWAQKMSLEASAKTGDDSNTGPPGSMNAISNINNIGGSSTIGSTGGKYVPPIKRGVPGMGTTGSGDNSYSRDDSATVRISNVSRSTEEADLEELCKVFGQIRRIFLSRDRDTGESKGFAFVAFHNKSDAEKCIQRLDGYGYDHLILSVEWSKPKEPRDNDATRQSSFAR